MIGTPCAFVLVMAKNIHRFLCFVALLCPCLCAGAKSVALSSFVKAVADSKVSFSYAFVLDRGEGPKMTGDGTVAVQGDAFLLEGNGLRVWCDGKTRWTVDEASEEAVIESVDASGDDFSTNPALLVMAVDEVFTEISSGKSKFDGKVVEVSALSPKEKVSRASMEISFLKLYFKPGTSTLVGLEVRLGDDSVCVFKVSDFSVSDKVNEKEAFRLDEKSLPKSYVITDLR